MRQQDDGLLCQVLHLRRRKPVFVTESKQVVPISNPELTRGHEGERVAITGEFNDGKLTIKTLERSQKR